MGKRLDCVGFSDVSGASSTRLVVGVISAMVKKELGERNFGFDSLKSRLNRDMGENGIYRYLYIVFYYLDIELPVSRRSTRSVLGYIQNTDKSCVRLQMIL